MTKFIIKVTQGQSRTAGTKAKSDVVSFLNKLNFQSINYHVPSNKFLRIVSGIWQWRSSLKYVKRNDIVIYQYPAYSRFMGDEFVKEVRRKQAKAYIILHDVNSLRMYKNSTADTKRELDFFNQFDGIIAHNDHMKVWLQEHGVKPIIVSLEIFDYVASYNMNTEVISDTVAYTGNLEKSLFLKKLAINTPVALYGVNPQNPYLANVKYHGSFDADKLGDAVKESFGLVWDGSSIDTCDGVLGEYLKFNNPHKTSFYLSKGMPVIIWDQAALADFIIDNKCGIAISSLRELDNALTGLTSMEKSIIKKNALRVGKLIREGNFLTTAISKLIYDSSETLE